MDFNFGPIARTEAGEDQQRKSDTFNLASLPLHVGLVALMAATNRDEFVAWLWHDLFKPAFLWQPDSAGKPRWHHIPGIGVFAPAEAVFAHVTDVPIGLVRSHHWRDPLFKTREGEVMAVQSGQIALGASGCYIQLSFVAEPAMTTAVVRAVLADSFIEVVAKGVAKALCQCLSTNNTFAKTAVSRM